MVPRTAIRATWVPRRLSDPLIACQIPGENRRRGADFQNGAVMVPSMMPAQPGSRT